MFLAWVTQLVKAAVLRGFHEAAVELEAVPDSAAELTALKVRMAPALPAPDGNRPSSGGKGK